MGGASLRTLRGPAAVSGILAVAVAAAAGPVLGRRAGLIAAAILAGLLDRSVAGELAVRVAGTAPLADAATVYAKVGSGGQRGRWLLVP